MAKEPDLSDTVDEGRCFHSGHPTPPLIWDKELRVARPSECDCVKCLESGANLRSRDSKIGGGSIINDCPCYSIDGSRSYRETIHA